MQQLNALHPRLIAVVDDTLDFQPGRSGWINAGAASRVWYHQTDIDLSGYALQDMSFFPSAVGVQDPGLYSLYVGDTPLTGLLVQVLDIVTSVPLSEEQILQLSNRQLAQVGPGMLGSDQEYETLLMGQYRAFTYDNSFTAVQGTLTLQRSQRFGSGEPTAADKLSTYRIVEFFPEPNFPSPFTPGDQLKIPAARFLINGEMVEEPDLVHMMRLKRSYELANQV